MKNNILELKNITYKVIQNNQEKVILNNINLQFNNNQIYVITGQNGSGKSTMVKIIMGIVKPTSGQIYFNGLDITNLSITERANLGLAFAFQQPITFKGLTIKNLLDAASGNSNKLVDACEYLSQVGLCAKNYINRDFDTSLSGGEQKRIELALLLIRKCAVNIFDEPEAGIDLWSNEVLINVFKSITGLKIIISHQKQILEIANEIIILNNGNIVSNGESKDVIDSTVTKTCSKLGGLNE